MFGSPIHITKSQGKISLWRVATSQRLGWMLGSSIHICKGKWKSPWASHHKSTTTTNDRIIVLNSLVKGRKLTTWADKRITDPPFVKLRENPLWRVATIHRLEWMTGKPTHICKVKGKSSWASHHKSTTSTDDRIIDPFIPGVKRKYPLASRHKLTTWMDVMITDP